MTRCFAEQEMAFYIIPRINRALWSTFREVMVMVIRENYRSHCVSCGRTEEVRMEAIEEVRVEIHARQEKRLAGGDGH